MWLCFRSFVVWMGCCIYFVGLGRVCSEVFSFFGKDLYRSFFFGYMGGWRRKWRILEGGVVEKVF